MSLILLAFFTALQPLLWLAEGQTEAERDIAAETMKWKIYGYMAGIREQDVAFARLMRNRFGVEVVAVAQCVVTDELVVRTKGYNACVEAELGRRFGPDALRQAERDASGWQQHGLVRYALFAMGAVALLWFLSKWVGRRRTGRAAG